MHNNQATTAAAPRHAGHREWWIEARAHLNRYGQSRGKHGVRHGNPAQPETRTHARVARIARALTLKPRAGKHGNVPARTPWRFPLAPLPLATLSLS